jgi:putative Holliday junction resolvase
VSHSARTYLAFDYGRKRIGVAVGQDLTSSANALTTLKLTNQKPPWEEITRLVEQWQPQAFVVGLPYNKDGSEHEITHAARRFGNQLSGRYQLPVYWVDERLTSAEAERILTQQRSAGRRKSVKKEDIDSMAAQLILQSWYDQKS